MFDVSVSVENLCLNIYDHGPNKGKTSSQLNMTVLMSSGKATSDPYFYSTVQYSYLTTNKFNFDMTNNNFTGPNALNSSVDWHSLSPSDSLVLIFLIDPVITSPTMSNPAIKCPSANHMFVNNINPSSVLKGLTTSSYTYNTSVDLDSLQHCDGPNGGCISPEINVELIFTNLRTTTTTSSTPNATTYHTITSTTIKPSIPQSTLKPENSNSISPGLIAAIGIAIIEFMIICSGICLYLRLRPRVRPIKQLHSHQLKQTNVHVINHSGNDNETEEDGCENGYIPALGHVTPEDTYYDTAATYPTNSNNYSSRATEIVSPQNDRICSNNSSTTSPQNGLHGALRQKFLDGNRNNESPYEEEEEDFELVQDAVFCVAMFEFQQDAEGTIGINVGERLEQIEKDEGDGWTKVRKGNLDEGFVPTSFIQLESSVR